MVNSKGRNQGLESNVEGCQKLMNSLKHFSLFPLRMSVAGTLAHVLTHDHCISMRSCWCCRLNTDITKRNTPYGGIAALGTVKYRSDVDCTYKAVFLVFRTTTQARFLQNSHSSSGYQNRGQILKFSTCSCLYWNNSCWIFQKSFSQKYYDLFIMLCCSFSIDQKFLFHVNLATHGVIWACSCFPHLQMCNSMGFLKSFLNMPI